MSERFIKPCPFCGGPGDVHYRGEVGRFDEAVATCPACDLFLYAPDEMSGYDKVMASVIERWNRRVGDSTP